MKMEGGTRQDIPFRTFESDNDRSGEDASPVHAQDRYQTDTPYSISGPLSSTSSLYMKKGHLVPGNERKKEKEKRKKLRALSP
jgi:hypothetical protein